MEALRTVKLRIVVLRMEMLTVALRSCKLRSCKLRSCKLRSCKLRTAVLRMEMLTVALRSVGSVVTTVTTARSALADAGWKSIGAPRDHIEASFGSCISWQSLASAEAVVVR
eukprot:1550478-Amphidinium_carterae.1